MGVASLVLGIISIIICFIPFCGAIAFVPAIVGLILGIVAIAQSSKSEEKKSQKGMGIAGTVLSAIATVVIMLWVFIFSAAIVGVSTNANQIIEALNSIDTNSINFTIDY